LRFKRATFLSFLDLDLGSDALSFLDLQGLRFGKFLPTLFFGELFGHRKRVVFDKRFEGMLF